MPKPKQNTENKIAIAALNLAAQRDWSSITVEQIAKAAKVPLAQAKKLFPDKDHVLAALVLVIDDKVAKSIGKPLSQGTPRDRLFEVMMARMDELQANRKAILGIIGAVRQNPRLIPLVLPAHVQAIKKLLSLAGLTVGKIQQPLVIGGLLGIYSATLCQWHSDQTPDLSKTMAGLDRSLRLAEKAAEILLRKI